MNAKEDERSGRDCLKSCLCLRWHVFSVRLKSTNCSIAKFR
jgi:hypothetical protein